MFCWFIMCWQVPGEGSLKIIQFIRSLKQSNDYKPNETHCIYSGDNDYLLLGIATHELYVSFIQEVTFLFLVVLCDNFRILRIKILKNNVMQLQNVKSI